jgi:plastocyanin
MELRTLAFLFVATVAVSWFMSAPAFAAEVAIRVSDTRGVPVANAVVSAVPLGVSRPRLPAPPATHTIDQKDETFIPYLEVFRPGDEVVFHNSDHTRHHVYSFAPARQFEFVLAPGESSPPMTLTQLGVIAVGCNIHDRMITYFYVTDAPYFTRSGTDGLARLDLPEGDFDVRVWHPRQRPGATDGTQRLAAAAAGAPAPAPLQFVLSLLPEQHTVPDRERGGYGAQ